MLLFIAIFSFVIFAIFCKAFITRPCFLARFVIMKRFKAIKTALSFVKLMSFVVISVTSMRSITFMALSCRADPFKLAIRRSKRQPIIRIFISAVRSTSFLRLPSLLFKTKAFRIPTFFIPTKRFRFI